MAAVLLLVTPVVSVLTTAATPAAAAINAADFQQVTLAKGVAETGEPMAITVLPDRSVLHTARNGTLRRTDVAGNTTVIANIPVYTHDEEGLQGVAADPNFASNRYIYLYYAPPLNTPAGDAPASGTAADWTTWTGVNRLSRFTLNTDNTLNLASQVTVLDVPTSRGMCCHVGGDIDFDAAGNLYLSTGDDSNPFESNGYSPLDERTNRNPVYDAQRSAGNTNDLRGKVLRIKVNANGSYSVPSGNLFAPGTANTRPEIYAMGFRNPFRLSVDKATGVVYVGDYGPDAGTTDANRGPSGQVEFDRITAPGNYGWPYCTGTNTTAETYNEWNFATNATGPKYNCSGGATNNSFRNTGLGTLPPARSAWIRYAGDAGSPPAFGGGSESPMAGPVYRYNAANPLTTKFPAGLDGQFFAGEFGRGWIKPVVVNADGSPGAIDNFPWNGKQVMDMQFGPDGSLYVLDYGTGYFNGDANSALYRYDYVGTGGNRAPTAVAGANRTSGAAPLAVTFTSSGSSDPEGGALTYAWAFGDGGTSTAANPSHTYTANGNYVATLTVRDPMGATGTASVPISVGNTAPVVTVNSPASGQLAAFGDSVPWSVTVTDPEDGTIDCTKVTMAYVLGHDQHAHQITSQTGCSGTITIPVDGEHDDAPQSLLIVPDPRLWQLPHAALTREGAPLNEVAAVTQSPSLRTSQLLWYRTAGSPRAAGPATSHLDPALPGYPVEKQTLDSWQLGHHELPQLALARRDAMLLYVSGHGAAPGAAARFGPETMSLDTLAAAELPPLVVLNGCWSGTASSQFGQDPLSLAVGALLGGADTVIAGIGRVDGLPSAQVGAWFVELVREGMPAAAALRVAQRRMRHAHPNIGPFGWAGLCAIGVGT